MALPASVTASMPGSMAVIKNVNGCEAEAGFDMLEVTCPKCRTPIPFVPELAGREVFCLGCGEHFNITNDPPLDGQEESERPWRAVVQNLGAPTEPDRKSGQS
jgi:uncharacterized Zn finger protein (UPF0148 family)